MRFFYSFFICDANLQGVIRLPWNIRFNQVDETEEEEKKDQQSAICFFLVVFDFIKLIFLNSVPLPVRPAQRHGVDQYHFCYI